MIKKNVFVSVIVPLYNAESFLTLYLQRLSTLLEQSFQDFEIILIDNASSDQTANIIKTQQQQLTNLISFRLSRYSGIEVAITAGLDNCIGDFIISLNPAYDPPELIPEMVELAQQGHEIVYGAMEGDIQASLPKNVISRLFYRRFYRMFQSLTGSSVPENFASYRLITRHVLNYVLQNEDRHRLLKVIPALAGFHHAKLTYQPLKPRRVKLFFSILKGIDIIFSTSVKPLRIVTFTGLLMAGLNFIYALYVLTIALFKTDVAEGWITLSLQNTSMFFLTSLILAIIGEYIFRMMDFLHKRPMYHIVEESTSNILLHRQRLNVISSEPQ